MRFGRRERLAFGVSFIVIIAFYAIGWALTSDQIWQNVYDSVNQAIRLHQVSP